MNDSISYKVYDADHHFYEPSDAFLRNLPREYQKAFQYIEINGRTKLAINNLISDYIPNPTFEKVAAPGSHEAYYRGKNTDGKSLREMVGDQVVACQPEWRNDREAKIRSLDSQGVHACLLFPTLASVIEERIDDPDVINTLMHSLNEWTYEEWGYGADGRIFGVPVINLMDIDAAVKELELLLSRGARTVLVRPAPVKIVGGGTRSFGTEEFDPFWARVNEAGIFVSMHSSDSGYDDTYRKWEGSYEFRPFEPSGLKAIMRSMDRAIADTISALICHGVFHRHPNVKVASVESGARWAPPLLDLMEFAYGQLPQTFQGDPAETFRKHVYVSPFYEDDFDQLKDLMGADRILFGSDFPHPEGLAEPLGYQTEITNFSNAEQEMVLSSNLKKLLGA